MPILHRPFQIIRAKLGPYLAVNVLIYGLVLAGLVSGLIFPELTDARRANMGTNGTTDLIRSLLNTPWLFSAAILGVNVISVGVLSILLPSMVVPFAGIALLAYRTFTLGVTMAPPDEQGWIAMIPHSLTVVIEFQAYILLALGAYLLGRSWLFPRTSGAQNRRQGYLRGLKQIGWLSLLALALLVIGAVYEAFSLRYLVPLLLSGLS